MMYDIEQIKNQVESTFPTLDWRLSHNPQQTLISCSGDASIFQVQIIIAEFGTTCGCVVGASPQSKGMLLSYVEHKDFDKCLKVFKTEVCAKVLEMSRIFEC